MKKTFGEAKGLMVGCEVLVSHTVCGALHRIKKILCLERKLREGRCAWEFPQEG